jgi:hypothetical protein
MPVDEVIRRARRRLMWNAIAEHVATASSIALGMLVLLLLLGSQLVSWQWLVLGPITAIVVRVCRVKRFLPDAYATAQDVDRRLNLADTLSSATFFSDTEAAERGAQWARHLLHSRANAIAGSLRLTVAVPYKFPRSAYIAVLLALVSGGLTALRYGYQQVLDLRPSLARVLNLTFDPFNTQTAELRREDRAPQKQRRRDRSGKDSTAAKEGRGEYRDEGDPNVNRGEKTQSSTQANQRGQDQDPQNSSDGLDGNGNENGTAGAELDTPPERQAGQSKLASDRTRAKPATGSGTENESGMIARLQEAMGNLLSRVGQQLSRAFGGQQAVAGRNGPSGPSQHGTATSSRSDRSKQAADSGPSSVPGEGPDAEGDQTGTTANARHNPDQQSASHPGNGAGSQEGGKDIESTEQLAVMGKIGQIIGRRSTEVAGEVSIEVRSGNAQVTAPYLNLNGQHMGVSGDVHRDFVSLSDQVYVQRYFEEIRRQPITRIPRSSRAKRSKIR